MTAKEFSLEFSKQKGLYDGWLEDLIIEHTKYHVQKALEKAANSDIIIKNRYIHRTKEDKESILNAYPIENIK